MSHFKSSSKGWQVLSSFVRFVEFYTTEEKGWGCCVLTPLSTLFQLYRGGNRVFGENHLSQVTDKLYCIMLYRTGFELTTIMVTGTDFTGTSEKKGSYIRQKFSD